MKTKILSKKLLVSISIALIAVIALVVTGCTNNSENENPSTTAPLESSTVQNSSAIYLGEGENTLIFIATDLDGNDTHYMIKTNKKTVGEALLEQNLIAGENGDYGLYVKTVNGITLDYDNDGKYWAFYENGNYATSGVDQTEIIDGAVYNFKPE